MPTCPIVKARTEVPCAARDKRKMFSEVMKLLNSIVVKSKEKFHTAFILRSVGV